MDTALDTVIIDPPASVLAERERLGLDHHDEVWDGEYHMVPNPNVPHQRIEKALVLAFDHLASDHGLELLLEVNLLASEELGFHDFRVPDAVIFGPEEEGAAGIVGPARLVVEVRSPGDESFKKLPFFERLGVGEVLIIDRDTKVVRRWELVEGVLVESPGAPVGHHRLRCIPAALHTDDGVLVITTAQATTRI